MDLIAPAVGPRDAPIEILTQADASEATAQQNKPPSIASGLTQCRARSADADGEIEPALKRVRPEQALTADQAIQMLRVSKFT